MYRLYFEKWVDVKKNSRSNNQLPPEPMLLWA